MTSLAGVLGVQDLGGVQVSDEAMPGTTAEEAFLPWEVEACTLAKMLGKKGVTVVDETRRLIESLPAQEYARLRYYEKWTCGSAALCLSAGIFTDKELEEELGSDESEEVLFAVGETVVVRKETDHIRWRKPHLRTPGYVHGKQGVIVRSQGPYEAPENIAFATLRPRAKKAMLYTVRFKQIDLWDRYANDNDTLDCDIYSHWLQQSSSPPPPQDSVRPWTKFGFGLTSAHAPHAGHVDHHHESRDDVEMTANAKEDQRESPYATLHGAVVRLCVAKGIFTLEELRIAAENMDNMAYGQTLEGARIVARAWVDTDFKAQLLSDAKKAISDTFPDIADTVTSRGGMGSTRTTNAKISFKDDTPAAKKQKTLQAASFDFGHTDLVVVADTPTVHNVVVCTLCSCYPRAILGLPPRYYTSRSYRARAVVEPRAVLADVGCTLPDTVTTVRVHDSTADVRFMVLPMRPAGTEDLSEADLATLATRDCLVGLALPRLGRTSAGT